LSQTRVSGAHLADYVHIYFWTIFIAILTLWLLGFSFQIAGGMIHLLLVVALAVLIYNLVMGRRRI
jgi:Family of unknown function (DUF5670)